MPDHGPLRLGGVPEHFNLPWHLAIDSPPLADLAVQWHDQPGGTGEMLERLGSGELDVVSILTEGTVAAIDGGLPVTIVQVYVLSPLSWGVFVPGGSALEHESQLEGRPIAISRFNSGSHLMAHVQADRNRWEIDPAQFVVAGGLDGARESFAAGHAEVFLWDRFTTQPLVDAGEFRLVGVQDTPWPAFVIAARNEALLGRTAEVGRVIDEVVAQAVGLYDRSDAVELISNRYGLRPETTRAMMASTVFAERSSADPEMSVSVLAALREVGLLSGD